MCVTDVTYYAFLLGQSTAEKKSSFQDQHHKDKIIIPIAFEDGIGPKKSKNSIVFSSLIFGFRRQFRTPPRHMHINVGAHKLFFTNWLLFFVLPHIFSTELFVQGVTRKNAIVLGRIGDAWCVKL